MNLILKSTEKVLGLLGPSPSAFLRNGDSALLADNLKDFKHRFTTGLDMAAFLASISAIQSEHGLIGNYLTKLVDSRPYIEALDVFAGEVVSSMKTPGSSSGHLLPLPSRGSACKRLHLFMRWMVREDDVDPGGWNMIPVSELLVPVDVHMHRIGIKLGFTSRKAADAKTAEEITEGFRVVSSDDPVKYDFALTRSGIQKITECELFEELFR